MKQLVLTGLGSEVDLKTGRTLFTAVFDNALRIEISQEAAQMLTASIYGSTATVAKVPVEVDDYSRPPAQEEEDETDLVTGAPVLRDEPSSVYAEEDTGVEQV